MKSARLLVAVVLFSSCATKYKMFDGNSRLVTIEKTEQPIPADSLVPVNRKLKELFYSDIFYLGNINTVPFSNDGIVSAIIARPTLFMGAGQRFIVFPGDHLYLAEGGYLIDGSLREDIIINKKSDRRTRELMFFNEYRQQLEQVMVRRPSSSWLSDSALEYSHLQRFIQSAEEQKVQIGESVHQKLQTGRDFQNVANPFIRNTTIFEIFNSLQVNKEGFTNIAAYKTSCLRLLPFINRIDSEEDVLGSAYPLNNYADAILSLPLYRITTTTDLKTVYREIATLFSGRVKDYMLSQVIYQGCGRHIIDSALMADYLASVNLPSLTKVVANVYASLQRFNNMQHSQDIIADINNKAITLQELLNRNKGKYIFLDFMASWCVPCIEDIPALDSLKSHYRSENIVFVNLSLDKQFQPWKKFIYSRKLSMENSFYFPNAGQSPFLKDNAVRTIPRYMLLDENGRLLETNLPRPSEPDLTVLLKRIISSAK